MQEKLQEEEFFEYLVFSDKASFHTNRKVSRPNVSIWGEDDPYTTIEHQRDSSKLIVLCAISKNHVHDPFILERNMTGYVLLQIL